MKPKRINLGDTVSLFDGEREGVVTGTMTIQENQPGAELKRSVCVLVAGKLVWLREGEVVLVAKAKAR